MKISKRSGSGVEELANAEFCTDEEIDSFLESSLPHVSHIWITRDDGSIISEWRRVLN